MLVSTLILSITLSACVPKVGQYAIQADAPGSPCVDSTFLALRSRPAQGLSDFEKSALLMKEQACSNYKANIDAANRVAGATESMMRMQMNVIWSAIGVMAFVTAVVIASKESNKGY
jgi:hypothetical protein